MKTHNKESLLFSWVVVIMKKRGMKLNQLQHQIENKQKTGRAQRKPKNTNLKREIRILSAKITGSREMNIKRRKK